MLEILIRKIGEILREIEPDLDHTEEEISKERENWIEKISIIEVIAC